MRDASVTNYRRERRVAVLLILAMVVSVFAMMLPAIGADRYPSNPVKLVITHAAGTSNDIEARTVQPFLQKHLGAPVVIENMAGTGGRKSREFVMKEKPDGYTLLSTGMPSCQIGEILFKGRYQTLNFTHIYSLFSDSTALLVKMGSPYKDMADFVAMAKGKILSCAVPGVGSTAHLNGMMLSKYLGLGTKWVPYDGGTEALTALAGGHVDYVICDTGSATALLNAKSARLLMVFEEKRDPRYPDIPTHKDLGYQVNTIPSLRGVVGPPGVSADVVKVLETAFSQSAQDKEFLALASKASVKVTPRDTKEFLAVSKSIYNAIKAEEEKLQSLMKPTK